MSKGKEKKSSKKPAKKSAKRVSKHEVDVVAPVKTWFEGMEVDPSSKTQLLWLQAELQRCGVRSIGDLENLIARAE